MKKINITLVIIILIVVALLGYYKFFSSGGKIIKIEANPERGFNFDYYVYLPYGVKASNSTYILVEPNNGGRVSDDHTIHEKDALRLIKYGDCHKIADRLKTPLLVPVFDRPESNWKMYTHALDRDSLMNNKGDLARIDLQLIKMIDDLKQRLKDDKIIVNDKVLMNGFSASGNFVNRFTLLHPEMIQAVASGGVNCMPIIPQPELEGLKLIYPIGTYDIKEITGSEFNLDAYKQVPQYIYMGSLDDNDTLPYDDAFNDDERELIIKLLGNDMHGRWEKTKDVYYQLGIPAEMIMYEGIGHQTNDDTMEDVTNFFLDNIRH